MAAIGPRLSKLGQVLAFVLPDPSEAGYARAVRRSGLFDADWYRQNHSSLHPLFRVLPLRHYLRRGEAMGLQPGPGFSPNDYLRLNPDVAAAGVSALRHYLGSGLREGRPTKGSTPEKLPEFSARPLRFDPDRARAPVAIHLHIYYPDLWPDMRTRLRNAGYEYDLYVTLTWRGTETAALQELIQTEFPAAFVTLMPNRGRDILPFVELLNAGAFDGYAAIAKIHTKKSPHRTDGAVWRDHLLEGVLPMTGAAKRLAAFLDDHDAGMCVSDGQVYCGPEWWGTNRDKVLALLRRVEIDDGGQVLAFPAGSIWWARPLVIGMLKALRLDPSLFEIESGQIDGTLAHAVERALGMLTLSAGLKLRQVSELRAAAGARPARPSLVSAFYLPQFHPVPENDRWWGTGFTEWSSVVRAQSMFPGHVQPCLPSDLGFYDLRLTDVMGQQARLARGAGIGAFCVYHYWFGGKRMLQEPLDRLLQRPEIDFPFYLCWANESWQRNWDGLSGEVLLGQDYGQGFAECLVASTLPYMRDPRYQRPDGTRPRFVIYRPEDMPDPDTAVSDMRAAWRREGIGEVELGAVSFHIRGKGKTSPGTFDFHVEMPPHGLVKADDFLFGGPSGNQMGPASPAPGFAGLIYDYRAVARRSCSQSYSRKLPPNTIAGIMPSWDNTARRGPKAHIAKGANPATFRDWLHQLMLHRIAGSYRNELFINAWNEWAERAMLEPSAVFGHSYLDVLTEALVDG